MPERPTTDPIPAEVHSVRRWIEQEVIAKGTCPPVARLAQRHRSDQGLINWDGLSPAVDIVSYMQLPPSSDLLVEAVSAGYTRFITDATNGSECLTRVFVLPDFPSNADYDDFINRVKFKALEKLLSNPEGPDAIKSAMYQAAFQQGLPLVDVDKLFNTGERGLAQAGLGVVDRAFNPVNFYGKPLTDTDVADFPDSRGDRNRQKTLSRAPYYLMQVVNLFGGREYVANLNRPRLHDRNTRQALGTDLAQQEEAMQRLRS